MSHYGNSSIWHHYGLGSAIIWTKVAVIATTDSGRDTWLRLLIHG